MQSRSLSVLAALGALVVGVGSYLPWLTVNPRLPDDQPIPSVYYAGMDSGIAGVDYVLLALAGLVLLAHLTGSREPRRSGLTLVTGVVTMLACVGYLLLSPRIGFVGALVPALGWYLTFVGAVVLAVAGGVGVLSAAALGPR
jgi:hypothetical protein